jgi:hypothetical protein
VIYFYFSFNYQAQLHITEPELYTYIVHTVAENLEKTGAKARLERRALRAELDDNKVGFALDLAILIENIQTFMKSKEDSLYGYTCVLLSQDNEPVYVPPGIWTDENVAALLKPSEDTGLATFGEHFNARGENGQCRLCCMKAAGLGVLPVNNAVKAEGLDQAIDQFLSRSMPKGSSNCLVIAPACPEIRRGLRRYAKELNPRSEPLKICFGAGGKGISCFADSLSQLNLKAAEGKPEAAQLKKLAEIIAAERFRDEYSPYLLERTARFLELLLENYAQTLNSGRGIVLLENLDEASKDTTGIFTQVYARLPCRGALRVMGYAGNEETAKSWSKLFEAVVNLPANLIMQSRMAVRPSLHPALIEMAYTFNLLRDSFPVELFAQLFTQTGRNVELVTKSLAWFLENHVIECPEDPEPDVKQTPKRLELVNSFVKGRILAAAEAKKFHPCFRLLQVLAKLSGESAANKDKEVSDGLILDAITSDVNNNTCQAIEDSLASGTFASIVGRERAPCLRSLYAANRALVHGDEKAVHQVFATETGVGDCPAYESRMLLLQATYKLSVHDTAKALATVKQALMLAQHSGRDLAASYRLFSLANVCRERLSEANDYFNFALENADKTNDVAELALCAFYAASAQYLYGNISLAQRLALRAAEAASDGGRFSWANRARFFYGRLLFETGMVKEALEIFEGLSKITGAKAQAMIEAWIFRCDVYLGAAHPRNPERLSTDCALFKLEAALMGESKSFSENMMLEAEHTVSSDDFLLIEQPDWRSGFSQVELLYIRPQVFYSRLYSVYQALSLANQGGGSFNSKAHEMISSMLREDGAPRIDPHDSFYYYADYLVLSKTGASEVDKSTALSMAFNRLQTRATRIDDKVVKMNYLHTQRTNAALLEEAKNHKLL